ncbi:MAG TPA: hypothetical protein ENI92_05760, partial [Bacteroidetes bacterium]|nr:hypothetical protein [Bacteroidota bacterium]
MKRFTGTGNYAAAVAALLLFAPAAHAQVTLTADDIPIAPGTVMNFYVQVDSNLADTLGIPVDLGPSGPNGAWDFTEGAVDSVLRETLLDPSSAPQADSFPDANRVLTSDGSPFGFGLAGAIRYESVSDTGWVLLGLGIHVENDSTPL